MAGAAASDEGAATEIGARMVFVVGARRSGTLWVQRILAAHPMVSEVPTETYLFSYGISQVFDRLQHGLISSQRVASVYADRDEVVAATRDLCDAIFRRFARTERSLLVERTPWHAHHLDLIAEIYPEARFVHVIRDGRDVARSLVAQPWGPDTVGEAATEWRGTVEAARAQAGASPRYREWRYERLLADPAAGARELYEWLGLDASPEVLAGARAAALEQQNLGSDATVGAGKWKREWGAAELAGFETVAGGLLEELGYPRERTDRRRGIRRRRSEVRAGTTGGPPRAERPHSEALDPQRLVEDLVAALRPGAPGLRELLLPDATIRVIDGTGAAVLRGEAGLERLERELAADPAFAGSQVAGESFPGIPSTTVSLVLELPDGARASRLLVLRPVEGRIGELTLIRPAEAGGVA